MRQNPYFNLRNITIPNPIRRRISCKQPWWRLWRLFETST